MFRTIRRSVRPAGMPPPAGNGRRSRPGPTCWRRQFGCSRTADSPERPCPRWPMRRGSPSRPSTPASVQRRHCSVPRWTWPSSGTPRRLRCSIGPRRSASVNCRTTSACPPPLRWSAGCTPARFSGFGWPCWRRRPGIQRSPVGVSCTSSVATTPWPGCSRSTRVRRRPRRSWTPCGPSAAWRCSPNSLGSAGGRRTNGPSGSSPPFASWGPEKLPCGSYPPVITWVNKARDWSGVGHAPRSRPRRPRDPVHKELLMSHYRSNVRDLEFNLFEVLGAGERMGKGPFAELDADTARNVLHEFEQLASGPIAASFVDGDRNPPVYDPATFSVTLPESFKKSYRAIRDGEWYRLELPTELGGYGASPSLRWAAAELILGANPALFMYSGGPNFASVIYHNGTEVQREMAETMIAKQWGSSMVLTEPDAGSDVGAGRTRAIRQPDGSWHLEGVKRF